MLNKLLDILKKEGKVIILDRETADFYVLTKWDEYEKLLEIAKDKNEQIKNDSRENFIPIKDVIKESFNSKDINNLSDEEKLFLDSNV
jgi:hypothetical protein